MNCFLFLLFFVCFYTQTSSDVFYIMNSERSTHHSHHSDSPSFANKSHHNPPPHQSYLPALRAAQAEADYISHLILQKQQYYNPSALPENDPYHPDYAALQNEKHDNNLMLPIAKKHTSQLSQNISTLSQKTASLPDYQEINYLKNEIQESCTLATQAEKQGAPVLASRLFDWGNSLFKCAQAIVQGIKEGTMNSVNACLHPVKTVQNIAYSVVEAGKVLALLLKECMLISHYSDMNQDDLLEAKFHSYHQKISELHATLSSFSKEDILRKATALGVEAILLHKITGTLCKFTKLSSEKLITFIETSQESSELVYAIEGVPFKISVTATDYLNTLALESETIIPKFRGKMPKPFKGKAQKWLPLEVKLPYLKTRFDFIETGWGALEGIKFHGGYEHVLRGMSFSKDDILSKISGFHHDIAETIASKLKTLQGIPLEVISKRKESSGIYEFVFRGYNKKPIRKTFFPSTWTHEQVFEKIYETIRYAKKNNIKFEIDGNYFKLVGKTKEKIKINMVFDKAGTIVTAHPIIG
ncbi:EndoU domain-containing protein [Candidatus Babeliales bacterium]|nr:EndoU domain-containing protein [Candidatus Babeliales bacterium]